MPRAVYQPFTIPPGSNFTCCVCRKESAKEKSPKKWVAHSDIEDSKTQDVGSKHPDHEKCINQWLAMKEQCPTCKVPIENPLAIPTISLLKARPLQIMTNSIQLIAIGALTERAVCGLIKREFISSLCALGVAGIFRCRKIDVIGGRGAIIPGLVVGLLNGFLARKEGEKAPLGLGIIIGAVALSLALIGKRVFDAGERNLGPGTMLEMDAMTRGGLGAMLGTMGAIASGTDAVVNGQIQIAHITSIVKLVAPAAIGLAVLPSLLMRTIVFCLRDCRHQD